MKTIMTIIIILLCIFTLFFSCKLQQKKSAKAFETPKTFLSDIDFSTGSYALYVRHKEFGDFVVDDESVLKANGDTIKITRSFLNWLPAQADRSYGVHLFKDGVQVKEKTGADFSQFELGDIVQYGKQAMPIERFLGVRAEAEEKLKLLSTQKNVYFTRVPKFDKNQRDFYFKVDVPSFAVTLCREGTHIVSAFDEEEGKVEMWKNVIKQRALERIQEHGILLQDFSLTVSHGHSGNVYLKDHSIPAQPDGTRKTLRYAETNNALMLESFVIYTFSFDLHAQRSVIYQLREVDFSGMITPEERQLSQLAEAIQQTLLQSNKPELAETSDFVIGTKFYHQTKVGEIREHTYYMEWIEVIGDE